jgi:membrane-bound ClpP family serine protease
MTELVGSASALDCAYFLAFAAGLIWAVFLVVTGGLGGDADLDVDAGGADLGLGDVEGFDGGAVEVSPISPITISTFVTAFGAFGVITRNLLDVAPVVSLLIATSGGLVLAGIMFLFYSRFLIGSQGSSEVRVSHLVGLTGEVVTPIAPGGIGEIAVVAQGARVTYPARASSGEEIRRGTLVQIDQMIGTQALVSPKE